MTNFDCQLVEDLYNKACKTFEDSIIINGENYTYDRSIMIKNSSFFRILHEDKFGKEGAIIIELPNGKLVNSEVIYEYFFVSHTKSNFTLQRTSEDIHMFVIMNFFDDSRLSNLLIDLYDIPVIERIWINLNSFPLRNNSNSILLRSEYYTIDEISIIITIAKAFEIPREFYSLLLSMLRINDQNIGKIKEIFPEQCYQEITTRCNKN